MLNSVISLLLSISIFFSSAKIDSSTNKLNYQKITDVFGLIDQEAEDDLFDPQTYQSNYDYLGYLENIKNTYGVKIDNDSPLDQVLHSSYNLSDLESYFSFYYSIEEQKAVYGNSDLQGFAYRTFPVIHERFPIEVLRCAVHDHMNSAYLYSVYKVNEGGYFYIFWEMKSYSVSELNIYSEHLYASKTLYLCEDMPKLSDYMRTEISSFADVKKISTPAYFFVNTERSGNQLCKKTYSEHVINSGHLIRIYYKDLDVLENIPDELRNHSEYKFKIDEDFMFNRIYVYGIHARDEFIIDHIEFQTLGNPLYCIQSKDYPEDITTPLLRIKDIGIGTSIEDLQCVFAPEIGHDFSKGFVISRESNFGSIAYCCHYRDDISEERYRLFYTIDPLQSASVSSVSIIDDAGNLIQQEGNLAIVNSALMKGIVGKNIETVLELLGEENAFYKQKLISENYGYQEVMIYFFYVDTGSVYELVEQNGQVVRLHVHPV